MTTSRFSLRTRFLLAMLAMVVTLCAAFGLAIHEFVEILEGEMLNHTLAREMGEFAGSYQRHPERPPPSEAGLTGYIVRAPGDAGSLPAALAGLAPGLHEDVEIGGREYYVDRRDVDGAQLYLTLDTERVDAIEDAIYTVTAVGGVLTLGLAVLIATLLARMVTRPVSALAREVGALDPGTSAAPLRGRFDDREVGVIAGAIDGYRARLNEVLEREQAFTEDASHELRTPLSVVASSAELLTEEPDLTAAGRERVSRIRRAGGQMQSLIEALLYLARASQAVPTEQVALDEVVREAIDATGLIASERQVVVDADLQPVTLETSPGMAACVVNNLLLNALNFTREGVVEVRLTPVELMVRDTGIGIPPGDLSRIFEHRYRGSQSRGLGLGLYLVRRICERLHWHIDADSAPGVGTRFRVRFADDLHGDRAAGRRPPAVSPARVDS